MFTTADHHYSNSMAGIIRPPQLVMDRGGAAPKWKYGNAGSEIAPNCPRCASSNTKFCYYNNYSLSQPRYFCKGCRRYWTKGGSLRNVPVGGGCRKSRRSRAARHPAPFPDPSPDAPGASAACIDMAAVFAKYVSPGGDESSSSLSPGDSSGSSENVQTSTFDGDCQLEDAAMAAFEQREPLDAFSAGEMMPQMSSTCWEEFGVQQEVVLSEDILWAEGTTPLPNFPMVQVEDCGLFTPDNDQLRIPANLVMDNWGSFDLSSYDFYSNL